MQLRHLNFFKETLGYSETKHDLAEIVSNLMNNSPGTHAGTLSHPQLWVWAGRRHGLEPRGQAFLPVSLLPGMELLPVSHEA